MLGMIWMGRVESLFILVMGGTALIFVVVHPMAGLLVLLLIDLRFFGFIKIDALPYLQVGPSLRINSQDMVTVVLLTRSFLVLARRRERPLFLGPLLPFFGVIMLSFLLGLFLGTADLAEGGQVFGLVVKYGVCFIIIATVDSRQSLETFIKGLYAFATVGLVLQFLENARGKYLVLNRDWDVFFQGVPYYIALGGSRVPYIWNRAQFYLYITFFLSLACLSLMQRWSRWHLLFSGMASLGFALMLIRSWYIYLGVGIVVMLAFLSGRWLRLLRYGPVLALLSSLWMTIASTLTTQATSGGAFINNMLLRLQTLVNFQEDPNFIGRVDLWRVQLAYFRQFPVFGLGPGAQALSTLNTDTG